ncbi:MAG: tetratricopeptide repeat protein [Cyanobacteria bacterium P01_A01_bin.45]
MKDLYNLIANLLLSVILSLSFSLLLITSASAADLSPSETTATKLFKMGVERMQKQEYLQAVDALTQAIESNPEYTAAHYSRCLAYLELQDNQNAIQDCDRAIKSSSKKSENYLSEAYLNRGLAYYRQGNYQAAISDNYQVIKLKPHDFRAYYNLGITVAATGNYQQAIHAFNIALTQVPQFSHLSLANIYNDRGFANLKLYNLPAAFLDFSQAIRFNPENDVALLNRGCTCTKIGCLSNAIADFSKLIELQPHNPQAYLNRGIARYSLGYEYSAIQDLQAAAGCFALRGEDIAYQQVLDLIIHYQNKIQLISFL